MTHPKLTIRDVTLRSVLVPMETPLVTRVITIDKMALLLIDLHTAEGVTGRTYLFGFSTAGCAYLAPLVRDLVAACRGDAVDPAAISAKCRKALTMFGHQGMAAMAAAGIDMACWDALARADDKPLARYLGGDGAPVKAYNSNGLGLTDDLVALADEAVRLVAEGNFSAAKVRVGRETLDQDLAAFHAVREAVGPDILLPVDFNQGLDRDQAMERCRALEAEDVYWIEEPIVYDDFEGYAALTEAIETPIQFGENFWGPEDMARALAMKASDFVMPDLERIGGITGWLEAARLAGDAGVPMSSHIFPEVSRHLMGVTPTAHWLEFSTWAAPVLTAPMTVTDGHVEIPDVAGSGVDWNEDAVASMLVEL